MWNDRNISEAKKENKEMNTIENQMKFLKKIWLTTKVTKVRLNVNVM